MIYSDKISVGSTPTDLMPGVDMDRPVEVRLVAEGVVYLGDSSVTTAKGLQAGGNLAQPIHVHGEHLYGVTSGGTVDVRVLVLGL